MKPWDAFFKVLNDSADAKTAGERDGSGGGTYNGSSYGHFESNYRTAYENARKEQSSPDYDVDASYRAYRNDNVVSHTDGLFAHTVLMFIIFGSPFLALFLIGKVIGMALSFGIGVMLVAVVWLLSSLDLMSFVDAMLMSFVRLLRKSVKRISR